MGDDYMRARDLNREILRPYGGQDAAQLALYDACERIAELEAKDQDDLKTETAECEAVKRQDGTAEAWATLYKERDDLSLQLGAVETERDEAREHWSKCAEFVRECMESVWEGCDPDGFELQTKALELGLTYSVPGGFVPGVHFGDCEAGDVWYERTERMAGPLTRPQGAETMTEHDKTARWEEILTEYETANDGTIGELRSRRQLADACKRIADLEAERDAVNADLKDWGDDYRRVLLGDCAPWESHCSCVPHLKKRIAKLEAELSSRQTPAMDVISAKTQAMAAKVDEEMKHEEDCLGYMAGKAEEVPFIKPGMMLGPMTSVHMDGKVEDLPLDPSGLLCIERDAVTLLKFSLKTKTAECDALHGQVDALADRVRKAERERDQARGEIGIFQRERDEALAAIGRMRQAVVDALPAEDEEALR